MTTPELAKLICVDPFPGFRITSSNGDVRLLWSRKDFKVTPGAVIIFKELPGGQGLVDFDFLPIEPVTSVEPLNLPAR